MISERELSSRCRPAENHKQKARPIGERKKLTIPLQITFVSSSGSSRALHAIVIWFSVPPSSSDSHCCHDLFTITVILAISWSAIPQGMEKATAPHFGNANDWDGVNELATISGQRGPANEERERDGGERIP
ncbi:hypothetical protein TIFTF001_012051 [Ficus carica]|uniref:Uncharacterized protein n=1 Tax=Ficus carica TaxID=3494 RepID=A0AA88ABL3_FICCA|nr:hypothetical protein TIFTF001_012051 [Ficus carica]